MAEAKKPKKEKIVDMYHEPNHHIQIKESLVDLHLKCGWRLKR